MLVTNLFHYIYIMQAPQLLLLSSEWPWSSLLSFFICQYNSIFPGYFAEKQPLFTTCYPHTSSPPLLPPCLLLFISLLHSCSPSPTHILQASSNLTLPPLICTWEPWLQAPTHSHQAFQYIPTGCNAYHTLAFFTHTLMHAQTHTLQKTRGPVQTHALVNNTLCGWWENEVRMNVWLCVSHPGAKWQHIAVKAKDDILHDSEKRCSLSLKHMNQSGM